MFSLIRRWRRQRLLSEGFPQSWNAILRANAVFAHDWPQHEFELLQQQVQVIVAEKHWEGCAGLHVQDEHRVTVAAQIARLGIGLGNQEFFDDVQSILLYPDSYVGPTQSEIGSGVALHGQSSRVGEAWYRGPVILTWPEVLATGRQQTFARNVIIHEFVHQLDMRNGRHADGVPVIESSAAAQQWIRVLDDCLARLREECAQGRPELIDCYGATSRSEFLAVASEVFFEEPQQLRYWDPTLFEILNQFFNPSVARP